MNFTYPISAELVPTEPLPEGLRFGTLRTTTDPPHAHAGVDLAWGNPGAPALAAAAGVVAAVNTITTLGGPGLVYIDHGDGWQTRYLHLAANPPVVKGQQVAQGEVIGQIANLASGPHLHFEVLQGGSRINPEQVLMAAGGGLLMLLSIGALIYLFWRWRR